MYFYRVSSALAAQLCLTLVFIFAFDQSAVSQARFEVPAEIHEQSFGLPWHAGASPRRAEQLSGGDVDNSFVTNFDFANGTAYAIEELPDGKLLVAGSFKSINGASKPGIFRLNADRSLDTTFTASIRGTVFRIIPLPDGKVIVGGPMTAYNSATTRAGVARLNSDGSLDTTFDAGAGPDGLVRDVILQSDGKIVVGGEFRSFGAVSTFGLARLNADGSVDTNFSSPLAPSSVFSAAAVSCVGLQPDGRIIVGGALNLTFNGPIYWVLRLNTDGTHDNTFSSPTMNSNAWELAVQPDGKIVLGGFFGTVNGASRPRVARLNADGTLDAGFTPGTGANTSVLSTRVLASGKILITGSFNTFNGSARGGVALLNPDGMLDATFAPTGQTTGTLYSALLSAGGNYFVSGNFSRFSGSERNTVVALGGDGAVDSNFSVNSLSLASIRTILTQADGKMLVGGFFNRLNGNAVNSVTRLNSDGTVDPTFASGVTIGGTVFRIIVQPDGKLLVLGAGIRINNGPSSVIVRLNADGTHDTSFTQPTISLITGGISAAVQPDGKIVFGYQTVLADPTQTFALVRLNENGSIDSSFSTVPLRVDSLAIMPSGQIMVAGAIAFTYVNSTTGILESHNAIIRLNNDGSHDRTFQSGLTGEAPNLSSAFAMHVQADGKILLGGRLYAGTSTTLGTARLNTTGTLDGTFQMQPISSQIGVAQVFTLSPTPDGKTLIGGHFQDLGGVGRTNVARLAADGSIDTTFTAATENSVSAVVREASGSIVVGGSFLDVNGVPRAGLARLLTVAVPQNRAPFDFDGDGKTDLGIFRAGPAEWWIQKSGDGNVFAAQFGATTDKIVPADYTGDGKMDVAFWRPSTGDWFVLRSEDYSYYSVPFGTDGDIPTPADYDNDAKADVAVFRPSTATWYISRSTGGTHIEQFGTDGDAPVVGDYDGDGKADLAIYRPSLGQWWLKRSTAGLIAMTFGDSNDKPVQGDFTGDGKTDVAFWRPSSGEWFVSRSEDFSYFSFPFGTEGDVVAPGDYDGDGRFDATIFRSSTATWYSQRTTAGTLIQQFGATGDRPIPNAFVP